MNKNVLIVFAVLAVLVWIALAVNSSPTPAASSPAQVTLAAAPGQAVVQMFGAPGSGGDAIARFPDRQRCTRISGPTATSIEGVSMRFYRLTCAGTTGYVNAKWVN